MKVASKKKPAKRTSGNPARAGSPAKSPAKSPVKSAAKSTSTSAAGAASKTSAGTAKSGWSPATAPPAGDRGSTAGTATATPLTPEQRAERRARWAIWLIVLAVLVWVPGGFSRFLVAKLLLTVVGVGLAATVPARARLAPWITRLFGLGALLFVIAALLGDTPLASLVGRWPRYEGLAMLGVYAACAWAGARLIDRPARVQTLVTATAAMSILLGVFSGLDAIGFNPVGVADVARSGSLLGNATDQGLIGMLGLAILFRPTVQTWRELYLFGIAGAAATTVLSGSRFALLAAVVVLVGLAVVGSTKAQRRTLLGPLLGGLGLLLVAVLLVPATRERLLSGQTVRGRLLTWDLSLDMVLDQPLLGWGPSRYVDAVGRYETQAWADWVGTRSTLDSPHNWLLQVQLAGGLPLLICALALAALTVWLGVKQVAARPELAGVFAGVLGYGAAMLANFTNPTSTCLAAFLAGTLVAVPLAERGGPESDVAADASGSRFDPWVWRDRGLVALAGFSVIVLLALAVSEIQLDRGFAAAGRGDEAAAADHFDSAAALRPGDPDTHMLSAQALAGLANAAGDLEAAEEAERHAGLSLDRTPDTYQSQVALGVALMTEDRPQEAYDVLDAAVADFPMRASAYVQRGLAAYLLGEEDAARADLLRANELGDRSAKGLLRQISVDRG